MRSTTAPISSRRRSAPADSTPAVAKDHALLAGPLSGQITDGKIRELYQTFVDPDHPDDYRWTWCGRFSVPLGLMVLERIGRANGGTFAHPVAYGTSVGWPELGLRDVGITPGAPCNLYHFVGYPGVAFTLGDGPTPSATAR